MSGGRSSTGHIEGTLQLGGVMAGKRTTSAGEWLGTRRVPHAFLVRQGKHLTYVLLKIPAARQK